MSNEEMTEQEPAPASPRPTQLHDESGTKITTTTICDDDSQNHSVVTERYLLARTKDERYVEQCTKLLLQIMKEPNHYWKVLEGWYRTFLSGRSDGSITNNSTSTDITSRATDTDDSTLIWKHQIMAEFISWILYILLTTKSRYHDHNNKTCGSLTTPGLEICQLEYTTTENNRNNYMANNPNACISSTEKVSSRVAYAFLKRLTSMVPLLSMTTIWYGIRFWSFQIQQRERRRLPQSQTYNRLTGKARQDLFHSQRQEMIRRSKNIKTNMTTPMTSPSTNNGRCVSETSTIDQSLLQRIRRLYEAFIVSIDTAIQSLPLDGPHYPTLPSSLNASPVTHQNSGDSMHYTPSPALPNSAISSTTLIHVIQWTYQFYMAYYFLHGKYPTVLHRLFQIRPVPTVVGNTNTSADGTLPSSNTSNNVITMIGTLMMLQLSWKLLLYGISQPALNYWIRIKPLQYAFRHLRNGMKKVFGIPRRGVANEKHKTYIYMEGTAAPIHTSMKSIDAEIKNTDNDDNDPRSNVLVCGICRNSGSTVMNATSA